MAMDNLERIAVFIDADNAQAEKIEDVLKDVSTYGRIVIKRAYGNWAKPNLKSWEKEIKRFAIGAIQQFDFASGKNASDMALTIDAMDLLHTGNYDGFVIVSSDSDFTTLAIKLHESGVLVIGYGNKTTVESFRNACDEFNYVENLGQNKKYVNLEKSVLAEGTVKTGTPDTAAENSSHGKEAAKTAGKADKSKAKGRSKAAAKEVVIELEPDTPISQMTESELDNLLHIAEKKYAGDDGYVNVASAGTYIKRVHSDFDIRALGYGKLPEYLRDKKEKYDVIERKGKGVVKLILYKCK